MASSINALVVIDTGVDTQDIQGALPDDSDVEVVGIISGLEEGWRTLQETTPDLVLLACEGYSDRALFFIESAVKQKDDRPVVVLTTGSPNGFVRRVFEAGADDILTLPEPPERIAFALEKAIARRRSAAATSGIAIAPMICILGPKGGTGKTLTATNLTVALALQGRKAVLIDLDLQFGDVGLALGLRPDKTIYDLARSGGSLDEEKLDAYLVPHSSGAKVLLAPTRPDQASAVTVDFLRDVFATLRTMTDYVVVDTPPGFTPEVIAAIDASSNVCMVGTLDSLSLKNTKLGIETLELMGYDPGQISLVLNRADTLVGISREDVDAIIGRPPEIFVPSNRQIPISVNDGVPIVIREPESEAARVFWALANLYTPEDDRPIEIESNGTPEKSKRLLAWRP